MAQINVSNMLNSGSVLPFCQQEIEASMKKILLKNGVSDVLYAGSNISQLTSVISYVIGSLNVNTAINLQETILPLATKRMNILFGARQLGYEPHSRRGYKYRLKLTQTYNTQQKDSSGETDYNNQTPTAIILAQNTVFQSGTKTYYYKGPTLNLFNFSNHDIQYKNDTNIFPDSRIFYKEIEVTEGTMISWEQDETLTWIINDYPDEDGISRPKQDYIIPFHDVENDGIQVFVDTVDYTEAPVNGVRKYKTTHRTKSDTFLIDDSFSQNKDKFVRMENIILQYPSIFFQYSSFGTPVLTGDIVRCNIFQTQGEYGNAENNFVVVDEVASQQFEVVSYELTRAGTSEESNSSIKENATVFNNTANRAVTKLDYVTITKSDPRVKEGEAWGGEDEIYPVTPWDNALPIGPGNYPYPGQQMKGHIWISTTPYSDKLYKFTPGIPAEMDKYDYSPQGMTPPQPPIYIGPGSPSVPEKYELQIGTPKGDDDNLWNWYQSPENIDGYIDPHNPDNSTEGIIDRLSYYKIMTMEIHHRQPLYVNFDYVCDIVKYDMTKTREEVNEKVMDTMSNYFGDQLEVFDADYLNSNLQRVIDTTLTENTGIGYEVTAKGVLYKDMVDSVHGTIRCSLEYPYETMFNEVTGVIDINKLPSIDTLDFGELGKTNPGTGINLEVDYSMASAYAISDVVPISCDIFYNTAKVGDYIVNNENGTIELIFDFSSKEDEIFGITASVKYGEYVEFDINYPFTNTRNVNIPFGGNTIPRLRNVEFIYN